MRYTCDKSTASPRPCRVRCWLLRTHTHTHLCRSHLNLCPLCVLEATRITVYAALRPPRARPPGGARGVAKTPERRCLSLARTHARVCLLLSKSHEPRPKKGALIHAYDTVQASGKRRHSARRARARSHPARSALTSRAWLCGRAAPALARNTLPPSAPADSPPVC